MLRKLMQLNAWQWRVLLGSVIVLPLFYFRLRLAGFKKALDWAHPAGAVRSDLSQEDELALAKNTAYAVDVAAKYSFWAPNCLTRSLALGWFLSRQEIPFEIRLGVPGGKDNWGQSKNWVQSFDSEPNFYSDPNYPVPAFTAHAWVEFSGVVLNDKEDIADEFSPFESGLDKHP